MPDLKDDLAALRIEREPDDPAAPPGGSGGSCSPCFSLRPAAARWWWFTRERPVEVEVATVTERAGRARRRRS